MKLLLGTPAACLSIYESSKPKVTDSRIRLMQPTAFLSSAGPMCPFSPPNFNVVMFLCG